MRRLVLKSFKRKKIYLKFELKKKLLKVASLDLNIPYCFRFIFFFKLSTYKRNSSLVRIRTYCFSTGRSRAIFHNFNMYRSIFREVVSSGFLFGLKKSSW